MTIEELINLYPEGKLQKEKANDNMFSLPINGNYFVISKDILSEKEFYLLQKLFLPSTFAIDLQKHPWFDYLFNQADVEVDGSFRIIQFQLKKPKAFLQKEWEQSMKEIFPAFVDFFFTDESNGLLIEQYTKKHYQLTDIQSIFLTLDADFDSSTKAFVGNFYPADDHLPALFHEEQQIFLEEFNNLKAQSVFSLSDVAIHHYTKQSMKDSRIIQAYSKQLVFSSEFKQIILSLWHHQGNISSTAKDLYMHRNTLHYRIEKFYEQSGLSLKKMDDLVFCYLLITK
ncbi:helix-turn-helix domain-containing protein [Enterococcus wangshanyuanii]|uniref:Fis family transcriptional regulator n=1 Tax=Enterococcus wangshanyuanii TaxID=2005703 RepID=A0ABQ1NR43_9ENTE|nr:helix-turn-helix domain-containing protein [Enterococcus wangshanyuanii]GGC83352.1 Fis family transcriptional regulator [Enterococcus wangshanyuanii]